MSILYRIQSHIIKQERHGTKDCMLIKVAELARYLTHFIADCVRPATTVTVCAWHNYNFSLPGSDNIWNNIDHNGWLLCRHPVAVSGEMSWNHELFDTQFRRNSTHSQHLLRRVCHGNWALIWENPTSFPVLLNWQGQGVGQYRKAKVFPRINSGVPGQYPWTNLNILKSPETLLELQTVNSKAKNSTRDSQRWLLDFLDLTWFLSQKKQFV